METRRARDWDEIRAEGVASGRVTEEGITAARKILDAEQAAGDVPEIDRLRAQVEILRREITSAREAAERRNLDLDALHMVWCDGGCPSGVHRFQGADVLVTEELVAAAEWNTKRLRRWYEAVKFRYETYGPDPLDPSRQFPGTATEWHRLRAERAASRTDIVKTTSPPRTVRENGCP